MSIFTIVNDAFVPSEQASVLVSDLGIQRGYGIFDFFKTVNGQPIFFEDHLDRFYHSATEMHLNVAYNREELKELIYRLIKTNNIPDSGIRITVTGGYSPDGYEMARPNTVITQAPLTLSKEINPDGISLMTYPHQRQFSHVKTIDYLMAVWLQPLVKEKRADDVLYHNNGLICECPRANFYIVTQDNKILTAGKNILKGIVRKHVLEICAHDNIGGEGDFTLDDVKNCKEAFITSSTRNILPVTAIDDRIIGNGKAGELTQWLYKQLMLKAK